MTIHDGDDSQIFIQKVPTGWEARFTNDLDGRDYFQHTMSAPALPAPAPRKILNNGVMEHPTARIRALYGRMLISCETCTFSVAPNEKKCFLMSCFGAFYFVEDRAFAKRADTTYAVRKFAEGMKDVFKSAEIPELTRGVVRDGIFERNGWFVVYCAKKWPRSFLNLGTYPAAVVGPTENNLLALGLFDIT